MDYGTILMIVAVIALFYFMLVRPQQKRAKEQKTMMAALSEGDRVMTISGIVGTIRHLGEKQAIIEISPGVEMTVVKGALSTQPVDDEFEYADDGQATVEPTTDDLSAPVAPCTGALVTDDADNPEQTDEATAWDNPTK